MVYFFAILVKGGGGSGALDRLAYFVFFVMLCAFAYWRAARDFGWRFWTWPWGQWLGWKKS